MFGFLKKKIKESIDKISSVIQEKEEPRIDVISEKAKEVIQEVKEEEISENIVEKIEEVVEESEKKEAIEEATVETKEAEDELIRKIAEEEPDLNRELEEITEEIVLEEEKPKIEVPKEEPKKIKKKEGLLARIKKAVSEKELNEEDIKEILWDLQVSLMQSDVATEVAEKIINDLKTNLIGRSVERKKIEDIVRDSLKNSVSEIMKVDNVDIINNARKKKPYLVIFLGFNGSGKTTTVARIGSLMKKEGLNVVFAAADTWRAASIEQLEEHGKNLGIKVIKQKYGSDPAAVIFDAVKHATANDIDVVLADTAGRSHANQNLIDELKKICRVNNPDFKLLVMDALTGNDVVEQSKIFNEAVGVDGMVLTKTDVYDKGGAILSSIFNIKRPILYLGYGQDYKDLKKFDSSEIVKNLLE